MYQALMFEITGLSALMLHNSRLSDPLNEYSQALKKVSGKRKKTDEDHKEMSRIEWFGGLYVDEEERVIVPGENIESMLVAAAKTLRQGREFKSAAMCDGLWPIIYDGPKKPEALFKHGGFIDRRRVGIQGSSVFRTRPKFPMWSLKFTVHYLPTVLNPEQVIEVMKIAGRIIGLCDYRPRHGRFEVMAAQALKEAA